MSLEIAVDAAAQKLIDVVAKVGPQATETLLATGSVLAKRDLYLSFLQGGIALLCLFACGVVIPYLWRRADDEEDFVPVCLFAIVGALVSAFFLINSIFWIADPVLWVGLSHPEVYLAVKALKL